MTDKEIIARLLEQANRIKDLSPDYGNHLSLARNLGTAQGIAQGMTYDLEILAEILKKDS